MTQVYIIIDEVSEVLGFSTDEPTGLLYASNRLDIDDDDPAFPTDIVVENNVARFRTEQEVTTELTRIQDEYDSKEYARLRKVKYDLLNQDEMRYDDLINSTTTWQDAIAAIKLEHPK